MNYLQLGSHGPQVSAIGLGTMGMSDMYGPADRAESIATIHAALDRGVTLLTSRWWRGCGQSPTEAASRLHSWRLPGSLRGQRRSKPRSFR